jgi:serine protease Do
MKKSMRMLACLITLTGLIATTAYPVHAFFGEKEQKQDKDKTAAAPAIETPAAQEKDNTLCPNSFAELAEDLLPTVVNISSTIKQPAHEEMEDIMPQFPEGSPFEDFFERFMEQQQIPNEGGGAFPSIPESSLGSGFIIDAEKGYIITNNHVIKDADEVRVTLHNDTSLTAEIIGRDEKTDLAVLKIDPTGQKLTTAPFGNSDVIRVGDWVLAIGNPFGLGGTVTAGIISARARDINSGPYDDYLQTDASINRGNSGGPMFNLNGEIIGINTAIFSPTGGSVGIGFAIPSSLAKPIIDQLIEYGKTRRGWLGVRIQSVTDEIAESLGLDKARGALIASVTPGGPAEAAGIEAGDIILEFNDRPINEMRELPRVVAETKIDTAAKVKLLNKGKEKIVSVTVGELEKAEEDGLLTQNASDNNRTGTEIKELNLSLAEMSDSLRDEYAVDPSLQNGTLITDIKEESEAAQRGLIAGDVIVEINQTPVKTPDDVIKIITEAKEKKRSSVLLLINRDSDVRFVALKITDEK